MRRFLFSLVLVTALASCASMGLHLTYDRYDRSSQTYVNDTAGFALTFGDGWRVSTDVDSAFWLFSLIPVPTGSEVSVRASCNGVGVLVETSRLARETAVDALQRGIFRAYEQQFRAMRYQPLSLERKTAHGIEYMEWVYQLKSPDFDRTFVEALFVRDTYGVRVRALTNSENYEAVRQRINRLLASLTAVTQAVD
jgi:hypothetical protein